MNSSPHVSGFRVKQFVLRIKSLAHLFSSPEVSSLTGRRTTQGRTKRRDKFRKNASFPGIRHRSSKKFLHASRTMLQDRRGLFSWANSEGVWRRNNPSRSFQSYSRSLILDSTAQSELMFPRAHQTQNPFVQITIIRPTDPFRTTCVENLKLRIPDPCCVSSF